MESERPSLEAVRERIDAIDAQLLALIDERSNLAREVAAAKRAAEGGRDPLTPPPLGIRPAREVQVINKLLSTPRKAASAGLIVKVWRELIAESLRIQGPMSLAVWGGRSPARASEVARLRFGVAPPLKLVATADDALAAAKLPGGVAVIALEPGERWWGRLLAEPKLKIFASLPCLPQWGPISAFAIGEVEVEPSGLDETYWVTDAPGTVKAVEAQLTEVGVAARPLQEAGGLKLFGLAGYFQADDERLKRAPGRLTGVIGAAPQPFRA